MCQEAGGRVFSEADAPLNDLLDRPVPRESQRRAGLLRRVLRDRVLFFSLHPDSSKKKKRKVKVGESLPEIVTERPLVSEPSVS